MLYSSHNFHPIVASSAKNAAARFASETAQRTSEPSGLTMSSHSMNASGQTSTAFGYLVDGEPRTIRVITNPTISTD
jgi:hypothetical protein